MIVNFNLVDAFVKVDLRKKNGEEYNLQGIFFRDRSDFGIILPVIKDIEDGLELITIDSPRYSREFEFNATRDFMIIKNDYLMMIIIEELFEIEGELKHKTRAYTKEELIESIRYVMEVHFEKRNNWEYSYFPTCMNRITNGIVRNECYAFLMYNNQEDILKGYQFINTLDAELYNGSPLIINYSEGIIQREAILGIFIKNPESIPELKKLPNTGIIVYYDIIMDLISRL